MGVPDDPAMTRVLLVEDQRTLAEAMMIAIDAQPDLECVGAASSVEECLELVHTRSPDVVIMDIHLPGADGIAGTRQVKKLDPDTRVFVLTADATPEMFADAATAGATGFLAKNGPFPDVLAAIRAPSHRRALVTGGTFAVLLSEFRRDEDSQAEENWAHLTPREREVLTLMRDGLGPRLIAERLALSEHTVRSHIRRVMAKLQAHSRDEAITVAVRTGLLAERR